MVLEEGVGMLADVHSVLCTQDRKDRCPGISLALSHWFESSFDNNQAYAGVELWALQCLGQELAGILTSQFFNLLNGDKKLALDHMSSGAEKGIKSGFLSYPCRGALTLDHAGLILYQGSCRQKVSALPYATPLSFVERSSSQSQILLRSCKFTCSLFCPYKCTCVTSMLRYDLIKMHIIQVFHSHHVLRHTVYFRKVLGVWVLSVKFEWVVTGPPSTLQAQTRAQWSCSHGSPEEVTDSSLPNGLCLPIAKCSSVTITVHNGDIMNCTTRIIDLLFVLHHYPFTNEFTALFSHT